MEQALRQDGPPDRICRTKLPKVIWFGYEIRYSGAYEVADYESESPIHLDKNSEFKKAFESGFPYCFLAAFTNFFLSDSMLLDFGFLTEIAW